MIIDKIEDSKLKEMAVRLKDQIPSWLSDVAEKISKDEDWNKWTNNPCTEDNARNISKGKIISQMHRRIFMKAGAELLLEVSKKVKEVKKLVQETENLDKLNK